jgi:hypothetical protein
VRRLVSQIHAAVSIDAAGSKTGPGFSPYREIIPRYWEMILRFCKGVLSVHKAVSQVCKGSLSSDKTLASGYKVSL